MKPSKPKKKNKTDKSEEEEKELRKTEIIPRLIHALVDARKIDMRHIQYQRGTLSTSPFHHSPFPFPFPWN